MKNKEKLYSTALASIALVLFLIFNSSTASASAIQSNSPIINETQITTNGSDQQRPEIYRDRIVWFDLRNEKWDIYMYNLSTSRETQIPINGTMPYRPLIYGDRIVWGDSIFTNTDSNEYSYPLSVIYMYDLSTSRQTQISASEAAMSPAIYGDRIVWMNSRNSGEWDYSDPANWDIYMYDLSDSKETQLFPDESMKIIPVIYEDKIIWMDPCSAGRGNYWNLAGNWDTCMYLSAHNRSSQMFPAIYEDKIVWMDSRNGGSGDYWNLTGNWDIYMYDLSTHKETQITTDVSPQLYPAIYSDTIVWLDAGSGDRANWEICGYNLTTSKEIQINTIRPWRYYHPAIYGNRIVWMDLSTRDWEIYMYDLSTSRETQITINSSHSQSPASPAIYGNRIVWEDERNGNKDIYMYTVSRENTGSNTEQYSDRE